MSIVRSRFHGTVQGNARTVEEVASPLLTVPDIAEIRGRIMSRRRQRDPRAPRRPRQSRHRCFLAKFLPEGSKSRVEFAAGVQDRVPVQVTACRSGGRDRVRDGVGGRLAREDGFERDSEFLSRDLEALGVQTCRSARVSAKKVGH